jgi:hypothetical protein
MISLKAEAPQRSAFSRKNPNKNPTGIAVSTQKPVFALIISMIVIAMSENNIICFHFSMAWTDMKFIPYHLNIKRKIVL